MKINKLKINKNKTILVWQWDDAPEEFRALSQNGGDEDWVAYIPREVWDVIERDISNIPWLNSRGFSCVDIEMYDSENGVVFIGAHG